MSPPATSLPPAKSLALVENKINGLAWLFGGCVSTADFTGKASSDLLGSPRRSKTDEFHECWICFEDVNKFNEQGVTNGCPAHPAHETCLRERKAHSLNNPNVNFEYLQCGICFKRFEDTFLATRRAGTCSLQESLRASLRAVNGLQFQPHQLQDHNTTATPGLLPHGRPAIAERAASPPGQLTTATWQRAGLMDDTSHQSHSARSGVKATMEPVGLCPAGHGLEFFLAPGPDQACSGCTEAFGATLGLPQGTALWGCRACNFDLCRTCVEREEELRRTMLAWLDDNSDSGGLLYPSWRLTGDFFAADGFRGHHAGYHFKQGPQGLGYYRDERGARTVGCANYSAWRPTGDFVAADGFRGQHAGYHFKQGPQGLGYYRDETGARTVGRSNYSAAGTSLLFPNWRPMGDFFAVDGFRGMHAGYHFKQGPLGLGYYRDGLPTTQHLPSTTPMASIQVPAGTKYSSCCVVC